MLNLSRLEKAIKEKGWSKVYFSDLLGKNKGWITDMKRGVGLPDANMLQAIADKLETTVEYLTDKTDIKNKPAADKGDRLNERLLILDEITGDFSPEEWAKLMDYAALLKASQNQSNK